jgi:hypothetical protein
LVKSASPVSIIKVKMSRLAKVDVVVKVRKCRLKTGL